MTFAPKKTPLKELMRKANDVLYYGVKGISDVITQPGYLNVDFADVRTAMAESGLALMGMGSGKGEDVDKMRNACEKAKAVMPEFPVDGEMQFDAAVSPRVAQTKCPDSKVAGYANTFIFPDINAGNIGYKIAQRLGGFEAYGPILQGLNAPINDLSRGCNAQEVYSMAIITAALA